VPLAVPVADTAGKARKDDTSEMDKQPQAASVAPTVLDLRGRGLDYQTGPRPACNATSESLT
jgi:hypothetical protein